MRATFYMIAILSIALIQNVRATDPEWLWSRSAGSNGDDKGLHLIANANGDIYATGVFGDQQMNGTITFGNTTLTGAGGNDIYLVKYSSAGNVLWARSFGGTHHDQPAKLALDASGNVYMTGGYSSPSITFGTNTLSNTGDEDIFLAKFDMNGNVLWAKSFGGVVSGNPPALYPESGISVAADLSGNVYLAGRYSSGSIYFDNILLTNAGVPGNGFDCFFVKLNSGGDVIWARTAGGTGSDMPAGMAIDLSGNVYSTGSFGYQPMPSSSISFGQINVSVNATVGFYLVKYDNAGNPVWANAYGNGSFAATSSISADHTGNLILAGHFGTPTLDIGNITLNNSSSQNLFIAKFSNNGTVLWAKSFGGTAYVLPSDCISDASGNILFAGTFNSPGISLDNFTLINTNQNGSRDLFICKLDASGNALWAKSISTGIDFARINADANNNVFVTGSFFTIDPLTIGNSTYTSAGWNDVFIARLCQNIPPAVITSSGPSAICQGSSAVLNASTGTGFAYQWKMNGNDINGATQPSYSANQSGDYSVVITNPIGCTGVSANANVLVKPAPASHAICMVTVDTLLNRNKIIWEKTNLDMALVDSVKIFRETTFNNFVKVGTVPNSALSEFTDPTSNPAVSSSIYKLIVKDTCGQESELSTLHHKTILLQSSFGTGNTINLSWNKYEGNQVDFYRILRDDFGSGNFQEIDLVSGSLDAYTDNNPPASTLVRYLLNTFWQTSCTATMRSSVSVNTSSSNIKTINTASINSADYMNSVRIYPNPLSSKATVLVFAENAGGATVLSMHVYDLLAKKQDVSVQFENRGGNEHSAELNRGALATGVYFFEIKNRENIIGKGKIVIE